MRTPLVAVLVGAVLSGPAALAQSPEGRGLSVTPNHGSVGTEVRLMGSGCRNPGQPTQLVFEGHGQDGGTEGSDSDSLKSSSEPFALRCIIPSTLDTLQGSGGGPVKPGRYYFTSRPVLCQATFTVTDDSLAQTGRSGRLTILSIGLILLGILGIGRLPWQRHSHV